MEVKETETSSGYSKPPWVFKGSALYQLHLVKAATARSFIPKELRLVEAFGYTLGGFFLASYDESPTGSFNELVVIAGIVWNPPTSCAWAARVLVSSDQACAHGRKEVGLPSQVARFSKRVRAMPRDSNCRNNGFLNMVGVGSAVFSPKSCMDIQVTEVGGPAATDICTINLDVAAPELHLKKFLGPHIKMSLPSFSGRTAYNPSLLKYSCQIECRVRAVQPAKVLGPSLPKIGKADQLSEYKALKATTTTEVREDERNLSIAVMLSKPLLALEFNCLKMQVDAPVRL